MQRAYRVSRGYRRRANTGAAYKSAAGAGITVCHREYIGDVTTGPLIGAGSSFDTQRFDLNPGVQGTFPWLANVASNFEQYRIQRMKFEFISTCADGTAAASNNSLGSVMGAVEYNVYGAMPQSKQQVENMYMARSSKPSESIIWYVDCSRKHAVLKDLYVRGGQAPPVGQDQRMYDYGYFVLATQGMQAQNVIGEIWVTYEITLIKPQMNSIGAGGQASLTNLSWAYQQTNASSWYFSYWADDLYLIYTAAGQTKQAGQNIRSPPIALQQMGQYPNTTITLAPYNTTTRLNSSMNTVATPNTFFNQIRESLGVVQPLQFQTGVGQAINWSDQLGMLVESIPPVNFAGSGVGPNPQNSGGICLYFPPTVGGNYRISLTALLTTNGLPATTLSTAALNASAGIRGICMFTQANYGTDQGASYPLTTPCSDWFNAFTDSNATSLAQFVTIEVAISVQPGSGAYEWLLISRLAGTAGYSQFGYSQWNLSVQALPDSASQSFALV